MTTWILPMPPSTNGLFRNAAKGRRKTDAYKAWVQQAGGRMLLQGPRRLTPGYVRLQIDLFVMTACEPRIDADNIKAIPDLLKLMGVIEDDRLVVELRVCYGLGARRAEVTVTPAENPWKDTL